MKKFVAKILSFVLVLSLLPPIPTPPGGGETPPDEEPGISTHGDETPPDEEPGISICGDDWVDNYVRK